jgi:hypothetical protein
VALAEAASAAAVVEASGEASAVEIVASKVAEAAVDSEVTEVGITAVVALATSQMASAQVHHPRAHLLAPVEEDGAVDSQVVMEAAHSTPTAAATADVLTRTGHPSVTVDPVVATASLSESAVPETVIQDEIGEIEAADIETATVRVGMAEMTTQGSDPTKATTMMIPGVSDDIEHLDSAEQHMGLSQGVYSVLSAFYFSSLSSARVSGQVNAS